MYILYFKPRIYRLLQTYYITYIIHYMSAIHVDYTTNSGVLDGIKQYISEVHTPGYHPYNVSPISPCIVM